MATVEPRERALRKDLALNAAIEGVSAAFASLGRVFLCVDDRFQVLHASSLLDRLIGRGAAAAARGRPVSELLGAELFGPSGTMRQLLLAGERREGWRSIRQPWRVFRLVENLEQSEATVRLTGESGTGKEVLARAIHASPSS